MELCSRCKKRMAVASIPFIDNGQFKKYMLCIPCARELGINMMSQMGMTEEDIERMSSEMQNFISADGADTPEAPETPTEGEESGKEIAPPPDSRAPAIDFGKLFGGMMPFQPGGNQGRKKESPNGTQKKERKYLTTYCQNLTTRAAEGKLDRIVGRDRELDRVIQILCRRQKNNPCLIGEPGVGKTAIAEALAQRIVDGNVPFRLRGCEVCLVDLTALVAGTQFRGQFESRVLGLLSDVKSAGNVILVIDEVHNIVGAGDAEGSMNAANILKPALSRGEIQVIGATTLTEYRKYIEKDTALERRFQPVTVAEPSLADTESILRGIKHYYEEYHGIRIPDAVLHAATTLSERYITDRYLPDKAIDLIDEAASHIALSSPELNEMRQVETQRKKLREELDALETKAAEGENGEEMYRRIADARVEMLRLDERHSALSAACKTIEMTVSDLADVIEIWTGVPASTITVDEYNRLATLEEQLSARVVGQTEAVSAVARAIRRNRAGVSSKRKPVSFIFAGPTGVGKTELVKVLSETLFSSPETLIRLDMSEFMDKFSVSRIIGAPPGYVGYDDAGQLTEKIRRRPYSVVLFDEIEKAHPDVMNILLQILDEGQVTDAQGRKINFANTVIVMTTNAGSTSSATALGFSDSPDIAARERTDKALSEFLRPEFLNRIDAVITFRSLTRENFVDIAKLMLAECAHALAEKDIRLTFTEEAAALIAERSYSAKYGARNMRRYIQNEVEDRIAEELISRQGNVRALDLSVADGQLRVQSI